MDGLTYTKFLYSPVRYDTLHKKADLKVQPSMTWFAHFFFCGYQEK